MNLGVIGLGHVGLVTAVCFTEKGFRVFGMDKDSNKINTLKNKNIPFFEPGLKELLYKNFNRLEFTDKINVILENCEVIFLCVGTPPLPDGKADLSQVEDASREIAKNLERFTLVVEKSTVPVKTAEWIKKVMSLYVKKNVPYEVASNPEFLREGSAVKDFLEPDRVVVGVESERAKKIFEKIYEGFNAPIIFTDIETAEIIKHASNAFLATKISFINMIADLCEKTGADILKVSEAMGLDKRIGREFLNAGIGYGGSCFPKDVKAFYKIGEELGLDFELLKCVDRINERRIEIFIEKIKKVLWIIRDKTFAIYGLAFKPGTDDVREAPSTKIIKKLLEEGAFCRVYDPYAMENFKKEFKNNSRIYYSKDPYDAAKGSNAILILTEWEIFENLDYKKIKKLMETPIIIDGRNCLDMEKICKLDYIYVPVGRKGCGY